MNKIIFTLQACSIAAFLNAQTFQWAHGIGGSGYDYGKSITSDTDGNVYTTGKFQSTIDFDPGAGTSELTSFGSDDVFIQKLAANGDLIWAKQIGGFDHDDAKEIVVDNAGNIYVTGFFTDMADFDPEPGSFGLTAMVQMIYSFQNWIRMAI
jgi:hypothetical protein